MFVKVTDGRVDRYPYSIKNLLSDNPQTSFPKDVPAATLAAYGVYSVSQDAAPEYDPSTQKVVHSAVPELRDGEWVLTKTVVDLTAEQIAANNAATAVSVREKRNALLRETDWAALSDTTMSPAMATYRQALRDITSQQGFPYQVDWPAKPE